MPSCRKRKALYKFKRPYRRRDPLTRLLVDIGISYNTSLGKEQAADFLREKNVPEPVIGRVIQKELGDE
jgi:hypothetical protein